MSHSPSHNRVREVEGKVKEQAASVAEQAGSIAGNVQQMASDAADRVRETASDVLAQGKARERRDGKRRGSRPRVSGFVATGGGGNRFPGGILLAAELSAAGLFFHSS